MSEYIKISEHPELIGKRARFKNNLKTYVSELWLQEGTIKQLYLVKEGDLDHIGLSIVFDKPIKRHEKDNMPSDSCYIMPDSYEIMED